MEEKNWFRKFVSTLSLSDLIGFFSAVIGAAATIIAVTKDLIIQVICVVVSQVFLIIAWVCAIRFRYKSKLIIQQKEEEIKEFSDKMAQNENEYKDKNAQLKKDRDHMLKQLSVISNAIKSNSIHSIERMASISTENEEQYDFLRTLKELKQEGGNDSIEEKMKEEIEKSASRFATQLFAVFNKYCEESTEEAQKLQNAYFDLKNKDLKVAITVKLMDTPYHKGDNNLENIKVYTAFRDHETFLAGEREIGKAIYTINGNSAFITCITKDSFIINNVKPDQGSYLNEHHRYDEFYNCAMAVPIRMKRTDGQIKFFGFLCCDCLNNTSETDIFDKSAAQYLFAFAQNMATFLETLDSNWIDRFGEMNYVSGNILEMLYKKVIQPSI